jgi:predicted DNA-binding protein
MKKRTSFYLSDTTIELLKKLAEKDDRSQAYIIEKLIEEAAKKAKIKAG